MNGHRSGRRRRSLGGLLATATVFVTFAAGPAHVVAECDGPIPSFRDALRTAKRVVIGDVITVRDDGLVQAGENNGWSSRFTLRIRHTPVGTAPTTMEIRDLPTQPCAVVVLARMGDRIALAFDATDFSPPIQVNTVAWIRGTPLDFIGVETTTTAEIFRLLELNPPDTSTAAEQRPAELRFGLLIAAFAGSLAGSFACRRSRPARRR